MERPPARRAIQRDLDDLRRLVRFVESRRFVAARRPQARAEDRAASDTDALLQKMRWHVQQLASSLGQGKGNGQLRPAFG